MRGSRLPAGVVRVLVAVAVFLVVPTTNVVLLCHPAYVAYEYGRPGFPAADRFDDATRLQLAQSTVRWLNSRQGIDGLAALQTGGEQVYNERELSHMDDVKRVMDALRWVWGLAGLGLIAAVAVAVWRPVWRRPVAGGAFLGGALLVAALAGILIGALLSFDTFFVHFHEVFFASGTWTFYYDDSLIQFYPLPFWMDATYILGAASLVGGLLAGGLGYAYLRRTSRRAQPGTGGS